MILMSRRKHVAWYNLFMGNIDREESGEAAVQRMLLKKAGLSDLPIEQFYCFSDKQTEKNTILLAYISLVDVEGHVILADVKWCSIKKLPRLQGFERKIIDQGYSVLQYRMSHYPISTKLLPGKFTMSRLYQIYQVIFDCSLDRRNFKKRVLALNILDKLTEIETKNTRRPAALFSFKPEIRLDPFGYGGILFKEIERKLRLKTSVK